jgi:hypothetical protein
MTRMGWVGSVELNSAVMRAICLGALLAALFFATTGKAIEPAQGKLRAPQHAAPHDTKRVQAGAQSLLEAVAHLPSIRTWSNEYDSKWVKMGFLGGFEAEHQRVENRYVSLARVPTAVFAYALDAINYQRRRDQEASGDTTAEFFPHRDVDDLERRAPELRRFLDVLRARHVGTEDADEKLHTIYWLAFLDPDEADYSPWTNVKGCWQIKHLHPDKLYWMLSSHFPAPTKELARMKRRDLGPAALRRSDK